MLRTLLELGRVSNLPTVWTNLTAAWLLGGGSPGTPHLAGLMLGGSLLYLAGMALNDAAGAEFDRENKPERPIPQGHVSECTAWMLGWFCLIAGAAALLLSGAPAIPLAAIVALILAYTFSHKRWRGCIYVMGGIRACLYFIGGGAAIGLSAAPPSTFALLTIPVFALTLGIHIVVVTATARCEYQDSTGRASIPGALLILPLATACVVFAVAGFTGTSLPALFPLMPVPFIAWISCARAELAADRVGAAVGKMLAGIVLIDALAVAATQPYLALLFCFFAPLLLLWQKLVAAT